jgi:hypothetical protein
MDYYSMDRVNLQMRDKKSERPIQELQDYSNHVLKPEIKRKTFIPQYFYNLPEDTNVCSDSVYNNMMLTNIHSKNVMDLFNNEETVNSFPINSRFHSNMEMDINSHRNSTNMNPIMDNIYVSTRCRKDQVSTSKLITQNRNTGIDPSLL